MILLNFLFTKKQINVNNLIFCFLRTFFWVPIRVNQYEIGSGYGPVNWYEIRSGYGAPIPVNWYEIGSGYGPVNRYEIRYGYGTPILVNWYEIHSGYGPGIILDTNWPRPYLEIPPSNVILVERPIVNIALLSTFRAVQYL